jgi:beta-lactam-binding protein with PASTA domain
MMHLADLSMKLGITPESARAALRRNGIVKTSRQYEWNQKEFDHVLKQLRPDVRPSKTAVKAKEKKDAKKKNAVVRNIKPKSKPSAKKADTKH